MKSKEEILTQWLPDDIQTVHGSPDLRLKLYNQNKIYRAMEEYAQQFQSGMQSVMKWVKASERLPDFWDAQPVREVVTKQLLHGWDVKSIKDGIMKYGDDYKEISLENIEWLDEQSPMQSDAVEFGEWLGDAFTMFGDDKWECFSNQYCEKYNLQLDEHYTTQQLYTIFRNQQSSKDETLK